MLEQLGIDSIEDLFKDIPESLILKRRLNLPEGKSEFEVERHIEETLAKNKTYPQYLCFLGGGVWPHYVPAVVDEIISRSEFYTSYTPYQPEISQGILQALFEYQSLICDLTSMDVANSSMYDWSTAVGEACRMAVRFKKRNKIVTSRSIGPDRLEVMKTFCEPAGIDLVVVNFDLKSGETDFSQLLSAINDSVAAVYLENPNFFGVIESKVVEIADAIHSKGGLFIVGVDPLSLGLLKPPGEYGADIVVGEGQPLGLHMNFGGPLLGIFACKGNQELIRQMPGRIIGMTTSKDGKRGFCMVLQTREQHIRRERATSNICTNEALCALASAVYLSLLGSEGLRELSKIIMYNSHYASKLLSQIHGVKSPYFTSTFFKDFTIGITNEKVSVESLYKGLIEYGILGGFPLNLYYKELPNVALFSVTEIHTKEDIEHLADAVSKVVS